MAFLCLKTHTHTHTWEFTYIYICVFILNALIFSRSNNETVHYMLIQFSLCCAKLVTLKQSFVNRDP